MKIRVEDVEEWGTRFDFPENAKIEFDGYSVGIKDQIAVKMAEQYDDLIASQIAMEARAEGISDLTVLNKWAILNAIKKQIPQKLVDLAKNELYGNCPVCGKVVHIGEKYCDQCGQALDWEEDNNNTREKLIELLEQSLNYDRTGREMRFTGGDVTPCLIANGVTIATDNNVGHKTNADRIRAMSDEELADWLARTQIANVAEALKIAKIPYEQEDGLKDEVAKECLEWLKQPAEVDNKHKHFPKGDCK